MEIVQIDLSQLPILRALAMRTYSAAFASKNAPGVLERYYETAFTTAELKRQLANPDSHWYFGRKYNHIIGYLKLNTGKAQTEYQEPSGLEIERIYIDNPFLNKGYGSNFIKFAVAAAREREKNYIWLGVWKKNPKAIRFYKKHQFVIVGTHDYNMIAEVQTDYIMRRDL